MADQPHHPDTSDDTSTTDGTGLSTARPRWKVALLVVATLALLLMMIVLHITGVVGANTNG